MTEKNNEVVSGIVHREDDGNDFYTAWVVVVAGFFLVLILYGSYYCFGVFLKPMLTEFGCSRVMITGAFSVYMIVHGFFSIIMGMLSDKYGPKPVVTASTLLIALGYALSSRITSPWHLYICFGLMVGLGMGAAYVPLISAVTKWFTYKRGLALGIVASGVGAGQMIMPPVMGYLITLFSWRTSYALMGMLVFVIGIPAALLLKNPSNSITCLQKNSVKAAENQGEWTLRETISTLSFKLLFIIFTALAFGISIVAAHLVAHVEDMGIAPVPASLVLTLIGGGGILGRIIIGGAADKFGNKIMLASCLLPLAILMFLLVWAKELWVFYMIAALFGLTYGGALPVIMKMSSEYYGVSSSGTIFGVLLFGATAGGAVGATLAGYIYDIFGDYAFVFLIGGIVIMVASVLSLMLKKPAKTKTIKEYEMTLKPLVL